MDGQTKTTTSDSNAPAIQATPENRQITIQLLFTPQDAHQLTVVTNGAITKMFRQSEMPCLEALKDWLARKDGEGHALGIDFEYRYYDVTELIGPRQPHVSKVPGLVNSTRAKQCIRLEML